MKKNNVNSLHWVNSLLFIALYCLFLNEFLTLNNAPIRFSYYFTFSFYIAGFYLLLRLIFVSPVLTFIKSKIKNAWVILFEFLLFFFTIAEIKLYTSQGLHFYDKIVLKTLMNPNFHREVGIGFGSVLVLLLIISVFIAIQFLLLKKLPALKKEVDLGLTTLVMAFFTFICLGYLPNHGNISNIYPLYSPLKGKAKQEKLKIDYHYNVGKQLKQKRNILFILVESLRGDYLTPERMPKLFKMFQDNKCLVADHGYSGGHTTEYGVFTALYGIFGYHFEDFREAGIPPFGVEVLRSNGYEILGGSASALKAWNNSGFMFSNFETYREIKSDKIYEDDKKLVDWLIKSMTKPEGPDRKPMFVFSFFNSTHHNYYFPSEFAIHKPIADETYNHLFRGERPEEFRKKIINRYKNSVLYMDQLISEYILKAMTELGDQTLLVFSGDHGEEFWEEGLLGHGKTSYINPRIQVPLVICGKGIAQRKINIASHADIFPTLLAILGSNDLTPFNGENLLKPRLKDYFVISPPQFPHGRNKVGVVHEKYKYWLKRSSSKLHELYKYRTTDLDDRPITSGDDQEVLKATLEDFSTRAYRFLKPIK